MAEAFILSGADWRSNEVGWMASEEGHFASDTPDHPLVNIAEAEHFTFWSITNKHPDPKLTKWNDIRGGFFCIIHTGSS